MTSDGVDTYAVETRQVLGKKVKRLRREGVLPANIYGRAIPSLAVQMPAREAREMLIAHGTNTLVRVQVEGEQESRPVMVRVAQRDPVSGVVQHLDFHQVDLTRTTRATVPITMVGEAPAVSAVGGILLQGVDSVQVEALPADVPTHFEISVEGLEEIDQQVTVANLTVPAGVTVLSAPDMMLARVSRPRLVAEDEEAVPEGEEELLEAEEAAEEVAEAGVDSEADSE